MILSVFSSYPIPPRLIKISSLFDMDVIYISWNRKKYSLTPNDKIVEEIFDDSDASKIGQYFDIIRFRRFLKDKIKNYKPEIIVCRNWKTFLIARTILTKNARMIYDVCDVPNHFLIRVIEKVFITKRTEIILASRFFKTYYKDTSVVLENRIAPMKMVPKHPSEKLRIMYLGVVRYTENLLNLIKACDLLEDVELNIYGYGNSLDAIREYKKLKNSKVIIHGEYKESDIPEIYSRNDVVWCAYPYRLSNVKIAISNKYFETLAFTTPGIFSVQTRLGELVAKNGIGYTVDPYDVNCIRNLIESIKNNRESLHEKENSIRICDEKKYWEEYKEEVKLK